MNPTNQYAAYMNKYLNQWDALWWYNILNILKITIKSVTYLIILVLMFRFSIVTPYIYVFFKEIENIMLLVWLCSLK